MNTTFTIPYILSFHFQFPNSACNNAHTHGDLKYDHLLTAVHLSKCVEW